MSPFFPPAPFTILPHPHPHPHPKVTHLQLSVEAVSFWEMGRSSEEMWKETGANSQSSANVFLAAPKLGKTGRERNET